MKALTNLKLCALALVLTAGMTSCLKTSDPAFGVGADVAYIEQMGTGNDAEFKPVLRIYSNYPMASATCTFEGKTYYFTDIPTTGESYYDFMELDYYLSTSVDTVTSGRCVITAVSAEDEPHTVSTQISFSLAKPLGEFNVESLEYDATQQLVTGKWNKVENATDYVLMYRQSPSETWVPYTSYFNDKVEGDQVTATLSFSIKSDTTLDVAVAAVSGAYLMIKNKTTFQGK